MAEKEAKKPDAAPAAHADKKDAAAPGGGGKAALLKSTPVLVSAAMILEAVILFAGFKFLGGGGAAPVAGAEAVLEDAHGQEASADAAHDEKPADDHGEKSADTHAADAKSSDSHATGDKPAASRPKGKSVEIQVVEFRAPNKQNGRTFLYDVSIYCVVKTDAEDKVKSLIKDREALIKDRIRTIIAMTDPEKLGGGSEPGLETLRRQVKYQLDEIVGEGLVQEVLVPRCIPYRADF